MKNVFVHTSSQDYTPIRIKHYIDYTMDHIEYAHGFLCYDLVCLFLFGNFRFIL